MEKQALSCQLIAFLRNSIDKSESTHDWLCRFYHNLIKPWRSIARNSFQEWEVFLEMINRLDPEKDRDIPLNIFSGRIEGAGRVTLSTLHSAKGREFDAVILFGINEDNIPNWGDKKSDRGLREARRLFYVGVTRPRKELCLVYQKNHHSPWVAELYRRSQEG